MPADDKLFGLSLLFRERTFMVDLMEPDRFVHRWHGDVTRLDHDRGTTETIGWFEAIYVDVEGAITDEESVFDVFDAAEATTAAYFAALYENSGEVRPSVLNFVYGRFYWEWAPNLLILDRLEVLPEFRGKGVGLAALWGLIRVLGIGAGIVAMKPFPLQCESKPRSEEERARWDRLELDALPGNRRKATAALRRYYRRLGFKPLPGTDYMVRDAGQRLPSIGSLMEPGSRKTRQDP